MKSIQRAAITLLVLFCVTVWPQRRPTANPNSIAKPVPTGTPEAVKAANLTQQIEDLSAQIERGMRTDQKRTIAVIEFADLEGHVTNFGRFLGEELITRLYQKQFKVIERQLLNKIIAEQKLSLTGVVDPSSARQLGKILGVDAIVSGTVTELRKTLRVNARLISTETGEIFAVAATEFTKDDEVLGLMRQGSGTARVSDQSSADERTRSQSTDPAKKKSTPAKIEAQAFTFEFNSCKVRGTYLDCYLWVTNNVGDRDLSLRTDPRSTVVDALGNKYEPSAGRISNSGGESG